MRNVNFYILKGKRNFKGNLWFLVEYDLLKLWKMNKVLLKRVLLWWMWGWGCGEAFIKFIVFNGFISRVLFGLYLRIRNGVFLVIWMFKIFFKGIKYFIV